LFHSFRRFSVPEQGSVFFSPDSMAPAVQNIFSRVTGSEMSRIFGTLGVSAHSSANLFLLNPNGILFGPQTLLNLKGSFFASTASGIQFQDGIMFGTSTAMSPLLTISAPTGLQFGAETPGGINVQGSTLSVQPERALALVGGELTVDGGLLQATQGQVVLGAIASNATLVITIDDQQVQIGQPLDGSRANLSLLDTLVTTTSATGSRGILAIGDQITLHDTRLESSLSASGLGGSIRINASNLLKITSSSTEGVFDKGLFAETTGSGRAGDIQLKARQLRIEGEARVSASTFGPGEGGNLTVNATERVSLIGVDPPDDSGIFFTGLLTDTFGTGAAGDLTLQTSQVNVESGAQISSATFGAGDAGTLTVHATESVKLIGTSPSDLLGSGLFVAVNLSTGNGGDLLVNTNRLVVQDGAQIFAGTLGPGAGGNININAETIEATGTSFLGFNSGIFTGSDGSLIDEQGLTAGRGGNISIQTESLAIREGGLVAASIIGNTQGGGDLTIHASEVIDVSGTEFIASNGGTVGIVAGTSFPIAGTGDAGDISLTTPQLNIRDFGSVAVSNVGAGNGGEITINSGALELSNSGQLTAETTVGQGGNIQVAVQNVLRLQQNSLISAEAGGTGDGGNIDIDALFLVISGNSNITANAFAGQGGNIAINTTGIFMTPDSEITASSQLGTSGLVALTTPDADAATGLVNLPSTPMDVANSVALGCGSAAASQFVVTGRSGLPETPTGLLRPSTVIPDLGDRSPLSGSTQSRQTVVPAPAPPPKLVEAQGWVVNEQGQVLLVAQSPKVTPQAFGGDSATCSPSAAAPIP
jgi:filamentous hemagglutinin family protein